MAEYYSTYCNIFINGNEIDKPRYHSITDVVLSKPIDGIDTVTINIKDADAFFIEDNIFIEDVPIYVVMGVNELNNTWDMAGTISSIDVSFPEQGDITLSLTCSDNSLVMDKIEETVTWENKTNIQIVQEISAKYGYKFVSLNPYNYRMYPSISQDSMTDLAFIEKLRDEELFPSYAKMVDASTFSFQTIAFNKPATCDVHYRLHPFDVISFSPNINRAQLKEGMLKSEINISNKALENAQATFDYSKGTSNGDISVTYAKPASSSYNNGGVDYSPSYMYGGDRYRLGDRSEKLKEDVEKEMLKNTISTLTGSLTLVPTKQTVNIKTGDTINIYGLGKYLSGMYLVTSFNFSLVSGVIDLGVTKTGFGDSVKSSTMYIETPDPNYVPPSDSASKDSGSNGGTPDGLDKAEHTTLQFTAYTHTGNNTASGVYPTAHHTCASWPELPFGTQIYVPSLGETYTVEDTGGAVTYGIIDIFMDTEQECWDFGRQDLEAYIIRL